MTNHDLLTAQYTHAGIHLPDRKLLRREFDAAVMQLDQSRTKPMLNTEFYRTIGDSVFEASYQALEDFVVHYTPFQGGRCDRMHVVSAPVGSGKTSFSVAFVAALVRLAEQDPRAPYGALVVVNQIEKADTTFRDLDRLLPGKVAIWTTEHDRACNPAKRERVPKPAAEFTKDELQHYPVAIVTHAFFGGNGGHKARQVLHDGKRRPRALTVIDERLEDVTVYDIALSEAEKVRERVWADDKHSGTMGPEIDELLTFMREHSGKGHSIERPTAEWEATGNKLKFFTTEAAHDYVRHNSSDPAIVAVFGFARALAKGYAFIARPNGGERTARYIGYQNNLAVDPGTVLLDATADIDGVVQLCSWRTPHAVPTAHYGNLHVVSVPPLLQRNQRLTNYLKAPKNRRAYVEWMVDTIKAHMTPGQRGLVICKLALIEQEAVPNWPEGDGRFNNKDAYTAQYGWDIEGRKLCVAHWGTGIGANTWKDAEVVFLFDEFWIPRRVAIATAQGLLGQNASQGPLRALKGYNSRHPDVDFLWEGHLLRWLKQMALRGRARQFDEHGVCGPQKLVTSADRTRLLANFDRLFPGAKLEIIDANTEQKTQAEALLSLLSRPGLPTVLTTKWISQQMGMPWRQMTQHLSADVKRAIENLGWRYVSRRGRSGSTFERMLPISVIAGPKVLPPVTSPSSPTATLLPSMPAQAMEVSVPAAATLAAISSDGRAEGVASGYTAIAGS
jgi:hypothetical protein